ncbi:MAG: AAA family ATPase [Microcoleaceae cyanobacterium]
MIPRHLSLKNFLSYRAAQLNFLGLHTACICGSNGSGKSSLLEAIAWAVWGNSRAVTEDDLIHLGELEVQVDFTFINHGNLYRIIRHRRRNQSSTLEFQVATNSVEVIEQNTIAQFRPLTERGTRATQQKIQHYLKLDYDTFINSAYLRQGRADEFMLRRPTERKEILASLLKLNEYEQLAERAKDVSKQYKGQIDQLQNTVVDIQNQLQNRDTLAAHILQLKTQLEALQSEQTADQTKLQTAQNQQHEKQTWEQLRQTEQQQYQAMAQDYQRWQQELNAIQQQWQELEQILQQSDQIRAGHAQFQQLEAQDEALNQQFQRDQDLLARRQQLQQQQQHQAHQIQQQIQTLTTRLEALDQQEAEQLKILEQQPEVEQGFVHLQAARERLNNLDQLQLHVAPLTQQRQQVQAQIDQLQARHTARLEELSSLIQQLHQNLRNKAPLDRRLQQAEQKITELEQKQTYRQQVLEKGQERRSFIDGLQHRQQDYEAQLAELNQKILLLEQPNPDAAQLPLETEPPKKATPACPLCDQPLDDHHLRLVIRKHRHQQKTVRDQIWVINEQLAASEQEIQVLRNEYRRLDQELGEYQTWREQRGVLQVKLANLDQQSSQLNQVRSEVAEINQLLQTGEYDPDLSQELHLLNQQVQALNYSEQTHALARNEEKRWRWVEIKHSNLQQAQAKLKQLQSQKPELETKLKEFKIRLTHLQQDSEIQQQIAQLDRQRAEINYSAEAHTQVRTALRQSRHWLTQVEKLNGAHQQCSKLKHRFQDVQQFTAKQHQDLQTIQSRIQQLNQRLQISADPTSTICNLEQQIQRRRHQMDQILSQLGSLDQQQSHLNTLETEVKEKQEELDHLRRQLRVHQELTHAFGKNGIQALMIENVLPQLEAEANRILARLSANQLHVQFVTQRTGRSNRSSKKNSKLIDTLEILIADTQGTRPYETYSGGEAFRINFAIRLALAKLLAQRAGAALQLLIIDEGFGTQDHEGCDRLIAAINAIASDFSCILTVTHIPHLKEAFQARIEVQKTAQGSELKLSV